MIPGLYKTFERWVNQTVWLYSDPHFDDKEQKKMIPSWPDAETQIKAINAKVGRKDTLIILGDVGNPEYVKQLHGYKILIAGNHDAGLSNYEKVFDEVYGGALFIGEKIVLSHEPIDIPFALNIHGHDHAGRTSDKRHFNVCSNVINFTPVSFNKLMKSGPTAKIPSIHRLAINKATIRKKKRVQKS